MNFVNAMGHTGMTYTENGAITPVNTGNPIIDFFFHSAAMRDADETRITDMWDKAFKEDPQTALRILFYVRDVRGGQGERRVFRVIAKHMLSNNDTLEWLCYNADLIPKYGRWDDLIYLTYEGQGTKFEEVGISIIDTTLYDDYATVQFNRSSNVTLLAKWMPSENASSKTTKAMAKYFIKKLFSNPIAYRKTLSTIRKYLQIVETKLTNKDYASINYATVPSKANLKYRKAFLRNDNERYMEYLDKVSNGEAKINASTIYPYEIVGKFMSHLTPSKEEAETLSTLWDNLPDYVDDLNGIVVADTSGSMWGRPMDVSVSLAMYIAERNKNEAFKDCFISFSGRPSFHKIVGKNLMERCKSVQLGDVANTNIQAVFEMMLNRAKAYKVPVEDMPKFILIVSDMEFDDCSFNSSFSNFENIRSKYQKSGYPMPTLVFWNVNSRNNHTPVTINDRGVVLVSGCSPVIMKYALSACSNLMDIVKNVTESDRYSIITY